MPINVMEVINGATPELSLQLTQEGFSLWKSYPSSAEEEYREIWIRGFYPEVAHIEIQDLPYQEVVA